MVIHLEDIHWADDRSLDLINNLVRSNTQIPLFIDCLARPSLYDRRPQWGEGQRFHEKIHLEPLSQLSSRRLVKELLKKVPEVPAALRNLIVGRADGNPFYIEELIKTLIDDGVIVKGEDAWSVDESRLESVRVPPTLTGVLQSRLDTLPPHLQQLAQRVSVVGRIFWDSAACHLSREAGHTETQVKEMLEELREREMILRREESGFAGTTEYVFRHAILRDVTYETLVPRQRRAMHRLVGDWLREMGGERAKELTLLVAEHYAHAGEPVLASEQLREAAGAALKLGAYDEARSTLDRARTLVAAEEYEAERNQVDLLIAETVSFQGEFDRARAILEQLLPSVRGSGNQVVLAKALGNLARIAIWSNDWTASRAYLDEALPIVREINDLPALMFVLRQMGNVLSNTAPKEAQRYLEESREVARKLGDLVAESSAVNSLGNATLAARDWERGRSYYEEALRLAREAKNSTMEVMALENLGAANHLLGHHTEAKRQLEKCLTTLDAEDHFPRSSISERLASVHLKLGEDDRALELLRQALESYTVIGSRPVTLVSLFAVHEIHTGDRDRGLRWVRGARRAAREEDLDFREILRLFADEVAGAETGDGGPDLDEVFEQIGAK